MLNPDDFLDDPYSHVTNQAAHAAHVCLDWPGWVQDDLEMTRQEFNQMTQEQLYGAIRTLLAALGGTLVTKGIIDEETLMALSGAGAVLIVGAWSYFSKRK